jgi:hypothetical protein
MTQGAEDHLAARRFRLDRRLDLPSASAAAGASAAHALSVPPTVATDDLAAARAWLETIPARLAHVAPPELIEATGRIEDTYRAFPELELDLPRGELAERLRHASDTAPGATVIPLAMMAALLEPAPASACTAALLVRLEKAGLVGATAAVLGLLLARHEGMAPIFAASLTRILSNGENRAAETVVPATAINSARNRLKLPAPGPVARGQGQQLLALAERVVAKLPSAGLMPPFDAVVPAWPTGRLSFAEFAAQWPELSGVEIEWLPLMKIGRAGHRDDGRPDVTARPGQSGHLVYGPYVKLSPGEYRASIAWSVGHPSKPVPRGQPVVTIEAVCGYGKVYLAQHQLSTEICEHPVREFSFQISDQVASTPVEVRLWTTGLVPLNISSIIVERRGPAPRKPE